MQKKILFLLLTLGCLLCGWASQAQNQTNCNLPAPTNIQFSQPNSTTLNVTWNAVPGAIGYMVTLENLTNSNQTTQAAITGFAWYNGFTVIPGNIYRFRVCARCNNLAFSTNYGQRLHRADYIVIDLVAQRGNCTPSGTPTTLNSGDSYGPLTVNDNYAATLNGSGQIPSPPQYTFRYTGSKIVFKGLGTTVPEGEILEGLVVPTPDTFDPLLYVAPTANNPTIVSSDILLDYPNLIGEAHISFAPPSTLFFKGPNGTSLTIHPSCTGGFSPGTNEGDDPITPTIDPVAQAALRNIQVVNPFASDLTLLFSEHPEQPIGAQLCDLSGRMQLQQTIEPGSIAGNQYKLATTDLSPGMYFLRLETAPGVFSTHKVVKYDQR